MEGMFGLHSTTDYGDGMSPDNLIFPSEYHTLISSSADTFRFGSDEMISSAISEAASITPDFRNHNSNSHNNNNNHNTNTNTYYNNNNNNNNNNSCYHQQTVHQQQQHENENDDQYSSLIKSKIASHPFYPRLLQAYIDCQKVGAPPEIACVLDEIRRDNDHPRNLDGGPTCLGADPELDEFMETYCDVLVKYKSDLERPFDEATSFLNTIEMQLRNLCTDEGTVSSDEYLSGGEVEVNEAQSSIEDRDLKDKLLRRFGGHISSLKLEFSKKKKKGKLPKDARQKLLDWWNGHYKWPYPTEADKVALAESTGLDQKQINNWFINQRKRHWKPSENMQFAFMNNISGQYFADD